ncbi:MFS transporter [Rhizobiaceae bacterium n13]|uniref:MFS transporter n=1 Tax=Ferirhizobium litorale TaxID=2927786 RepID=A0AAE3QCP1_9HYPH|nr:YbfB/YjiJ family MFS transporter [Fererhizobium litorale]MDI7860798.1 MFS transporter [Fererhizobium litorale]MDI7920946.1 MFS transporter [Fererhizobium litorale]
MSVPHPSASLFSIGLAGAIAMASAMGFGRFSFTPILPGMISGLPMSAADAGLVASGNFAGYFVGAVLSAYGWAAGRERMVALLSLLASSVLLAAMGLTGSVPVFVAIRFLAGIASAFAMIFTSSIVLGHAAAAARSDRVHASHFGGVGAGIALSSLVVMLVGLATQGGHDGWRIDWLAGAAFSLAGTVAVWWLLPAAPPRGNQATGEPPISWTAPLLLTTLSYGLFGFGYVITATFLVTMARQGAAGPAVEFLCWFIAGVTAAVSIAAWRPFLVRWGLAVTYMAGLLTEALGVVATVMLPPAAAPLVGGLLFGATFMMITAYGLQIGRKLSPESPRKALAFMTAAFGIGQIIGPLVAGAMAESTGSFAAPTLTAAAVLAVCMLLVIPVARRIG